MVVKLYGIYPSSNVLRAAIILHEKNVPFEFVQVQMRNGEHKSPSYLEKHPFGQVPYIDDDGFILYESRAIGQYIATKYANQGTPGLIPTEIKAFAHFQQACQVEQCHFHEHAGKAYFELGVKPFIGLTSDKAVFDKHIAAVDKSLDVYEKILSKQKYLAGDTITLADLYHIPTGNGIQKCGSTALLDEKRPNVARWWKDITSRPSWVAVKDDIKSTV